MDLAGLEALLSPQGQALLSELAAEEISPSRELALNDRLRKRYPAPLVIVALELAQLRLRARSKFSMADQMYFTREGLEQASSEMVARHRARRYESERMVADLCCGIGGDLIALAPGREMLAVDRDPLHARIAELNESVCGHTHIEVRCEDVTRTDLRDVGAVFVDPARRRGGRRELQPEGSSPPLSWCLTLADTTAAVGIKAAPGVPRELAPPGWELEFISVAGDLKEGVFWSPGLASAPRRATLLPEGHTLLPEPGPEVKCALPGEYLLDPDPAVTRAGLVQELARSLNAWKLDPEIAFLSTDSPVRTPFARTLRVEESLPWSLKSLRGSLRRLDVGAVDIRKRGSPVDVEELRSRLKLDGSRQAIVVLTRVLGKPWTLLCFPS